MLLNAPRGESDLALNTDNGLVYCLKTRSAYQMDLGYNKLTGLNEQPWGSSIHYLSSSAPYTDFFLPRITGFESGGYLMHWQDGFFLKGGYVNAQGLDQSPLNGIELLTYCQDNYSAAKLGNEVYFGWTDSKISNFTDAYREIRMQKFGDMTYESNSDATVSPVDKLNCYPNPFRETVTIDLLTSAKGWNELSVYNLKGQKVKTLLKASLDKGAHPLSWNGRDSNDKQVATGIYYLRLKNSQGASSTKVLYLK
jgi:hypothetical protein